jgi:cytoskeleton protein RodZ
MANLPPLTLDNGGELDRPSLHPRKALGDADLPVESVGQDLCKARQRRGKQLSDVWLVLKIHPDHLIAIEEGRFEALPGRVYAIGYVRSYAAYLGLDAENFVDRLKAEMAARGGAKDYAIDWVPLPERKFAQGGRVIAGLLLVALIYSGYQVFASAGRSFEQPVLPVPARLAAEAGLKQEPVAARPLVPVEQPAPILPPEPALPVPTVIAPTPPVSLPAELAPRVQAPLPPGRRYGVRNRNSRITLRVHRPTHVAVQGTRNRTFIDRRLSAGDTYRVPNMVGLRLSAPDAGAVEVILDGSSVGFAGENGVVARGLSLNPQNIIDRRQRG